MDKHIQTAPVSLFTGGNPEELRVFSLVLSAAHIPHALVSQTETSWEISVAGSHAERAEHEIAAYVEENSNWPVQLPIAEYRPIFRLLSPFVVGCLVLLHLQSGNWEQHSRWFLAGAGDSTAILEGGQYYRLITALTLHADGLHLLGNCLLGGFLLHYYFQILGNGIGFAGLLITAALANLLNVIAHGPGHHFVGFSTAVFSVIGMLSSLNYRRHSSLGRTRLLMPFMAGSAMLAMVGSSGEHTDLGAHFFGLVVGLTAGYLLGLRLPARLRTSFWLQFLVCGLAIGVCFVAWQAALA